MHDSLVGVARIELRDQAVASFVQCHSTFKGALYVAFSPIDEDGGPFGRLMLAHENGFVQRRSVDSKIAIITLSVVLVSERSYEIAFF